MNALFRASSALFCLLLGCSAGPLRAGTLPPGFSEQNLGSGWNEPVGVAFDPGAPAAQNRVYVWERNGKIWIVENGVRQGTPLIDLSDEVGGWRDYGLLGVALHPNFEQNGYIYLSYVVDRHHLLNAGTSAYNPAINEYFAATIGRITRYTARASDGFRSVDPASRRVLVGETKSTGFPILHQSHGTGHLVFGTDGTLLASCGDAASYSAYDDGGGDGETYSAQGLINGIIQPKEDVGAFRAQLVDSLSGKVIRIDPLTGDGLPSNPFYDATKPRAAKSRVWALGVRNPYRFTVRPGTGSHTASSGAPGVILLGDVGFNTWEDLQVIDGPGQNCGWPLFEGLTANAGYQASPVENRDAPNPLGGFFRFRDLLIQETLATPSWPNPLNPALQVPASVLKFMHKRPVLEVGRGTNPIGPVRTGIFNGTTAAVINVGVAGSPVAGPQFAGNASTGGTFYTGSDFPTSYRGTYFHADYSKGWIKNIALDANNRPTKVTDFATTTRPVFVATHPTQGGLYYVDISLAVVRKISYAPGGNQSPVAVASADVTIGPSPLAVTFSSAGSLDPDGTLLTYLWDFGDGTTSAAANPAHIYSAAGTRRFDVTLTVTDSGGATAQAALLVFANHTLPSVKLLSPVDGAKYSLASDTEYALTRQINEVAGHPTTSQWNVFLHHNDHAHGEPPVVAPEALVTISPIYSPTESYWYRVQLIVTDDLGAKVEREARLFPNATNLAPIVAWSVSQQNRSAASTAVILDPAAIATDVDSPGIETGELQVTRSGGGSGDLLSIASEGDGAGQVNVTGGTVLYGGVAIGEVSGGSGAQPLTVRFNEAATPAAAQAILRRIGGTFATAGTRILSATLDDGDGGISSAASLTINVDGSANQPPAISLTAPSANATFIAPATIRVMAAANDPDGTVSKVEFFAGTTRLGESQAAPFAFTWSNVPAGSYSLSARATDNAGASTVSAALLVTVSPATSSGLPTPWQTGDIGSVGAAGSATYSAGRFTVSAAGYDIWGDMDRFRYVWQPWSGDGEIIAQVESLERVSNDTLAGVMFRESLAPEARNVVMDVTVGIGALVTWREQTASVTYYKDLPGVTAPRWVKLKRSGPLFTGSVSTDGFTWRTVHAVTVPMAQACYVGLATCAVNYIVNDATAKTTAVFSNVSVVPSGGVNQPPTVVLTSPLNGATFNGPAAINLTANANDADGTVTRVEFFNGGTKLGEDLTAPYAFTWSGVSAGTYSITAKATDSAGAVITSAAVGMIVNAPVNQLPSVALSSPAGGASFTAPALINLTANASDSDGTIARVEFLSGGTKLGEDTSAPFAFTWSAVGAGTYSLTARAIDNAGGVATSAAVVVSITAVANKVPTVALTSPANGAGYNPPALINLAASASDTDGSIAKVEFFAGATRVGEDATAPYGFAWSGVAPGTYSLTARATDNSGATTISGAMTVSVNRPPAVTLTSPLNNAVYKKGSQARLVATASDSDGRVTKVEFFRGTTRLKSDAAAPFEYTWNNLPLGTFTLTARATDDRGAVTVSPAATISVVP